jgi:hypothetical protein
MQAKNPRWAKAFTSRRQPALALSGSLRRLAEPPARHLDVADLDVSGATLSLAFIVFPPLEPSLALEAFERWGIVFLGFTIAASANPACPVRKESFFIPLI